MIKFLDNAVDCYREVGADRRGAVLSQPQIDRAWRVLEEAGALDLAPMLGLRQEG